jgi:hypothetical protein
VSDTTYEMVLVGEKGHRSSVMCANYMSVHWAKSYDLHESRISRTRIHQMTDAEARSKGWRVFHDEWYCPTCAEGEG